MTQAHIYALICPIKNEPRYVGQTIVKPSVRLSYHKSGFLLKLRKNERFRKSHKEAWFYNLHKQDLLHEVKVQLIAMCDVSELDEREIMTIADYKAQGYDLTNTTLGGGQPRGYKRQPMTDEAKAAISVGSKLMWQRLRNAPTKLAARAAKREATTIARYGTKSVPMSLAGAVSQKEKLSIANTGEGNPFYGRTHTEESKAKQSAAKLGMYNGEANPFYGKEHTEEVKSKIRAARAAQVIPSRTLELYQHDIFVCEFAHINEAVAYLGTIKKRALYNRVTKGTLFGDGYRLLVKHAGLNK